MQFFYSSVWSDDGLTKRIPYREFSIGDKEVEESFRHPHGNPGKRQEPNRHLFVRPIGSKMLCSSGGEPRLCYPLVIGDPTVSAQERKTLVQFSGISIELGAKDCCLFRVDFQLVNGFCSQYSFIPLDALFFSHNGCVKCFSPHLRGLGSRISLARLFSE